MNSKMTVFLVLAFAVAMATAAPKPRTVYSSPLVTYTGGIAYHAPAAIYPVYPVVDANGQVVKDENCPGCPDEGVAASFVTATPAYYI